MWLRRETAQYNGPTPPYKVSANRPLWPGNTAARQRERERERLTKEREKRERERDTCKSASETKRRVERKKIGKTDDLP